MRRHDRFWATSLAVVVWMFAGYAVASGPVASTAITPPALDATAAVPGHATIALRRVRLGVLLQ